MPGTHTRRTDPPQAVPQQAYGDRTPRQRERFTGSPPRRSTVAKARGLAVTVDRCGEHLARVLVDGEIDLHTVPTVDRAITGAAALLARGGRVELDLNGTSFLALAGISMLLSAQGRLSGNGITLAVQARPDSEPYRVFELATLVTELNVGHRP